MAETEAMATEKPAGKKRGRKKSAAKNGNGMGAKRGRKPRDPGAKVAKQLQKVQALAARLTGAKARLIELIG